MSKKSVLIVGVGFLGLPLCRRFQEMGWDVLGLTQSSHTVATMGDERFPVRACDISKEKNVQELAAGREKKFDVVIHCASSGKGELEDYRQVYYMGVRHLLKHLPTGQMIFTSSTSVYAQLSGAWVSEESSAEPKKDTGLILRDAEDMVLAKDGAVLRLSALYGPGRSVLLRKFFNGQAVIEGDGTRWINQIHRDDAVDAYVQVVKKEAFGLYNVSDDFPIPQATLYEFLAERFEREMPPYGEIDKNKKRGHSSKRVANSKLRTLGWRPKYTSFFDAIEQDPWIAAAARPEGIE